MGGKYSNPQRTAGWSTGVGADQFHGYRLLQQTLLDTLQTDSLAPFQTQDWHW
jgi:hypothetical protein